MQFVQMTQRYAYIEASQVRHAVETLDRVPGNLGAAETEMRARETKRSLLN